MGGVILISSSAQAQNLFEADNGSGNIYKFTPGGVQSTFASGLHGPVGLAFDGAGNLFVTDSGSSNIYEFTPGGMRSTFASGLNQPNGLAFDSAGNLFETDYGSSNIYEFTPGGVRSTFASGLNGPVSLAFDSAGNLFVTDSGSSNIYEFTPGGVRSIFASGLNGPGVLAFDSAGNLFETDFGSGNIYKFTPGGMRSTFASGLNGPGGLAFDSAGNLLEADNGSGNIYKFTPGGVRSTFASGLSSPMFLAFAPPIITSPLTATATIGQLFVYQITATNSPTSFGATPLPAGLAFDSVSQHTGVFGGTPTNPGTPIQLTASNSGGTGTATLILAVQPFPLSGPVIASGTSITARTGQPFSFEVFTTGGSATKRLSTTILPLGLSADPATGVISGTPTTDGSFPVTLIVTDGAVTNFTSTLQLTFTSDPAIPVIISPRETALATGQFFTYTIVAPSSDHSGTTFSLIGNLPLGLSLDAATGTISGIYSPGDQNGGALLGNVQLGAHNSSGSATSPLSFFQAVSATAKNISTRLAVGTNDNVLIGGFIVTGNAPKKVIVRAIGPSLAQHGITNPLQDPTLELYDATGTRIAKNDDWQKTQMSRVITADQSLAIEASGHAPTDHRESAMIVTLAQHTGSPTSLTGHYTVHVLGKNGTTGAALVEVFDLGTASLDVSSNAQLANISTRGMVQTGDNVMIGGFIVQGDMPATVIVRAIGPSLAQHGITNPLQDPTLDLHDSNGTRIAFNDNWIRAPNKQAIINSGQAPSNNLESAILRSLSPGNYTAIVRGKNGTTGVALVETYVLQ